MLKSGVERLTSEKENINNRLNSLEMHLTPDIMIFNEFFKAWIRQGARDPKIESGYDQIKAFRNWLGHPRAPDSKEQLMRSLDALVNKNLIDKGLALLVDGSDAASYEDIQNVWGER